MARPEWMTPAWVSSQKAKIEDERSKLREELGNATAELETMGTPDPRESGDIAEEDREDFEVAGTLEVIQWRLGEVEEALDRIEAGSYGRCADCHSWISLERLSAKPSALRCIACQDAYERRAEELRRLREEA